MPTKIQNNKKSSASRPSIKQDKRYIKNVITADIPKKNKQSNKKYKRISNNEKSRSNVHEKLIKKSVIWPKSPNNNKKRININDKVRRLIIVGILAFFVISAAIGVGLFTFFISTSSKLSFNEDVSSKLVPFNDNQSNFMLVAIDVDNDEKQCPDVIMLTRADPINKSFILVDIPILTYIAASYGGGTTLDKIYNDGGDLALLDAISSLSEVNISSYVKISSSGLINLVDALNGIEVNLKEYVDDANINDTYIPLGKSTIFGNNAISLLKAKEFKGGEEIIFDNQRQVCMGILKAALHKNKSELTMIIDKLAGEINTSMGFNEIISFVQNYSDVTDNKIMSIDVPGFKTVRSNNMVYMIDASEWKNLRIQMSFGMIPANESNITIDDVNPSGVTVEVQNGAGVEGAGANIASKLGDFGFNVISVGNAESNVYKETLIIYNGEAFKNHACAIKNSLNNGRIVDGSNLYNMKSDILFIIGGDLTI